MWNIFIDSIYKISLHNCYLVFVCFMWSYLFYFIFYDWQQFHVIGFHFYIIFLNICIKNHQGMCIHFIQQKNKCTRNNRLYLIINFIFFLYIASNSIFQPLKDNLYELYYTKRSKLFHIQQNYLKWKTLHNIKIFMYLKTSSSNTIFIIIWN